LVSNSNIKPRGYIKFGKAEWFRERAGRQRIESVHWKGTIYRGLWLTAIALPALLLLVSQRGPEMLVWLVASGGLFAWDWRQVKRGLHHQAVGAGRGCDVFYIGDDPPHSQGCAP